jgi:hypothetical protein
MDAVDFFLTRYGEVHTGLVDGLFGSLSDTQLRARGHPGVNTAAWLLWHSARIEDVALNRFLPTGPGCWSGSGASPCRGATSARAGDAEVDVSPRVSIWALRGYLGAVTGQTLAVAETLRGSDLGRRARRPRQERRPRRGRGGPGRRVAHGLLGRRKKPRVDARADRAPAPYGHYYEARVAAGLLGSRSP